MTSTGFATGDELQVLRQEVHELVTQVRELQQRCLSSPFEKVAEVAEELVAEAGEVSFEIEPGVVHNLYGWCFEVVHVDGYNKATAKGAGARAIVEWCGTVFLASSLLGALIFMQLVYAFGIYDVATFFRLRDSFRA